MRAHASVLNTARETDQIVYRGRDAVGAISQRGREWLALDIDGRKIGSFPTRLSAFSAVLRKGDVR
jgi:hypothetical protein